MKIIDKYILFSYLKIFFSVLTILYFIFILQAFWLFIDKFAGKDLDAQIIIEFLIYYTPNLVPMVLPLSVLLAAIMSFGNLAEHYEFAAMKSAGISLQRAMRPLLFFIIALSLLSFWFSNNISPKMEYKYKQKKEEIIQAKPAMAILPGQFNSLGKMTIKVDEKYGKKRNKLKNVTIHIKASNDINNKAIIKADSGRIETLEDTQILKLHLFDGTYYEDIENKNSFSSRSDNMPFAKSKFKDYIISIDLSKFNEKTEVGDIQQTAKMMNISQLNTTIDSLKIGREKEFITYKEGNTRNILGMENQNSSYKVVINKQSLEDKINQMPVTQQMNIFRNAINTAESQSATALSNASILEYHQKNINYHWLSYNEKFVIAFSCLLMFFIGAPLGAIIRKGGLGMPMVLAVIIFITYHFINTFGRKVAGENGMNPFLGSWLSTLVLLPLAISFTYKATRDRGINSIDNIKYYISSWFKKLKKKKKDV